MGQFLGLLLIGGIIYYPFIKPLLELHRGEIILKTPQSMSSIKKYRQLSFLIAGFHLLLTIYPLFLILKTIFTRDESLLNGYDYIVLGANLMITVSCLILLFQIGVQKKNGCNYFKTLDILPMHSLLGILGAFFLGGHLLLNENQVIIGVVILGFIIMEGMFLVTVNKFIKRNGLEWINRNRQTK